MTTNAKNYGTELKKARPVRAILQRSIEDIQDGRWICGSYAEEYCDLRKGEKPAGCAVGLVAINDGVTSKLVSHDENINGVTTTIFEWVVPEEWGVYSKAAQKAVTYLARTTPKLTDKAKFYITDDPGEYPKNEGISSEAQVAFNRVISVNDYNNLTPKKALNWFKRALDLYNEEHSKKG